MKCPKCRSINLEVIAKCTIANGLIGEYEIRCKDCGSYVDYFAYGTYKSEMDKEYYNLIHGENNETI